MVITYYEMKISYPLPSNDLVGMKSMPMKRDEPLAECGILIRCLTAAVMCFHFPACQTIR